jgi:hypothetical protein
MHDTIKHRPQTKAELIERMRTARADWDAALREVGKERMTQPGVAGEWTVKDVISHMLDYDHSLILTFILRQQRPPDHWVDFISSEERNQIIYKLHKDQPLDALLAQSEQVFRDIMIEIERLPEAYLLTTQQFEGIPFEVTPINYLEGDCYGHYHDHAAEIRQWLASVPT